MANQNEAAGRAYSEEKSVSYASVARVAAAAYVPATDEDVAIFRRMSICSHARALKSDRRDAARMLDRTRQAVRS